MEITWVTNKKQLEHFRNHQISKMSEYEMYNTEKSSYNSDHQSSSNLFT